MISKWLLILNTQQTISSNSIAIVEFIVFLSGDEYLPGVMGMNVIGKTDYINVVVEALSHVTPIRDFFLIPSNYSYSKVLFHNGFQFRVLLFMLLVFS